MTTQSQALGAGFTEFGIEFFPITTGRLAKLDVWMQDNYRKQAIETAAGLNMTGELLSVYFKTMHQVSAGISTQTSMGQEIISSLAGCLKLIEVSSDGKCTEDILRENTDNDEAFLDTIGTLIPRIRMLTDSPDDTEAAEGTEKKA